jgi:hypothetical protein
MTEPTIQLHRKPFVKLIRQMVSPNVIDLLATEFRLMRDALKAMGSDEGYNDPTVPNTFSWYSPLCFESLSLVLQPKIEKILGEKLYPTYSYGRIYTEGSELVRHVDRRSSEVAVNINIARDEECPSFLYFEWEGQLKKVDLEPGDVVVYSGSLIPHWREKYTGREQMNAFMQYVFANGHYSDLKYDTRPYLATPYELTEGHIKDEVRNYV